ncbi:hypothetical protein BD410DRAFT_789649 [Rickenella mellea]|uniref:Replication protein A C-terminal domain-containing protein n=1 Tax=Rickenella mellea TaxID=50990 RepID=A0A4Y7Q320_9AGAM|nr:hypothetical protein BD410DRAFT_789649 [Rickenella mellea]
MCVCVTGTLKQFGNKRYISATRISPLKNPHKLNYFAPLLYQESLSRIQPLIPNKTHPTTTPRPNYPSVVPCTFSVNADGEHDMIPDLLTLKRKIVNFMQHYVRTHQPTVESLHIDAIAHGVEAGVWEVRGALDNLIDEGAVYYTFDDFHFACTDYNFIVTPNGAYDMVPLLPAMHRKIVHFILGHRRTMVGGVHISAIARGVGTDVREAREALNSLVDAAEVFSTIDDSHFDINFPMAAGNEQVFGSTNEYHRHVSSSIPAHASQVSASGTYDMFADLPSLQRKITGFIQKQPTTEMGVHISAIADALGMDINNLSDALDKLLDDGYVYNTIDDSHFQVTF